MSQSIASDTVKLTASKIITLSISMLSAMLLSRFLTLEEYGTYSQLLLVINVITTFFMLGLPNSINYFLARAETELDRQKFLSIYYTLSWVLSFISGLLLVLGVSLIIEYFDNPLIKNFLFVLAILPWANITQSSIENVLIVYHRTKILVVFRVLNSLLLLLIIVLFNVFNLDFKTYMVLFVTIQSIFSISVYIIVKNISGSLKVYIDAIQIKKILKFSLPIGLASALGVLSVQLDKIIIGRFYSTEEIAIYTNAAREIPVTIIATSLTAVLMPQLVKMLKKSNYKGAINLWGETIEISYAILCFFSIALFVFAPEILTFLYSEKYIEGTSIFRIYSLVLLLRFTYFGMILNSIGKTHFIFYSSIASLGLNLILSYFFVNFIGFEGPAIATLISIALIQFYQLVATSKAIKINLREIFPWNALIKITLTNIFLGSIIMKFKSIISLEHYTGEIVESIILGVLWTIIYSFLIFRPIKDKWNKLRNVKYD